MTITRLEVIPGLGVAEAVAELDCDYGTFMLMGDELYILDDQEDDWEPVDMDIVAEDPEQEQDYVEIREALENAMRGYRAAQMR
jgi:hypothetical protein